MSVEDVSRVVTYASNQSDRWFAFAMLAIVLIFAGMVIRYLVGQLREQRASHEAQQKENNEQNKQVVIALHESTNVIREVKELMASMRRPIALIVALASIAAQIGCAGLDRYDRTYSASYIGPEGQTVSGSITLRPREGLAK